MSTTGKGKEKAGGCRFSSKSGKALDMVFHCVLFSGAPRQWRVLWTRGRRAQMRNSGREACLSCMIIPSIGQLTVLSREKIDAQKVEAIPPLRCGVQAHLDGRRTAAP